MLYQLSYSRSGVRRLVGAPGRVKDYSTLSEYACVALAPVEDFRRDSDLCLEAGRNPETQQRNQAAMKRGLQTRDAEMDFARLVGELAEH